MQPVLDAKLEARTVTRIAKVSSAAWDRLAPPDNPFLSHAFLDAAEASRSATEKTGWQPFHLILENGGRLIGVWDVDSPKPARFDDDDRIGMEGLCAVFLQNLRPRGRPLPGE